MRVEVLLTENANHDLEEIYNYIAEHDSLGSAENLPNRIADVFGSLGNHPDRGSYPKELSALGIREYRQVFFKPYRIIYRVVAKRVYVYLIADGGRDFQSLLARRLLRS